MRLELNNISQIIEKSLYFSSKISISKAKIYIIGADAAVHSLLKQKIELLSDFTLTTELIASFYRDIPGQYAFIVLDEEQVTVVSDPYGIIKMYYFASEKGIILTDSLTELEGEKLSLDTQALKYYFVTGYTPSKHTFFNEVQKIEPLSINIFDKSNVETKFYGCFGKDLTSGNNFLEKFHSAIRNTLEFTRRHYDSYELALSGGIDSTFLMMLMKDKEMFEKSNFSAFKMVGLGQKKNIDNDYDILHSKRLTEIFSKDLKLVDYDFTDKKVTKDFSLLRDSLCCDYAPAMGYIAYSREVEDETVIVNGQNADSVLSFGGMGWPRFNGVRLTGLNGFFTRYFQFYGTENEKSFLSFIARLLRKIYYRINYPDVGNIFNRKNYFKGIGLNPENRFYDSSDPAYQNIKSPDKLADWFETEYIEPLLNNHKGLSDHALSVILYNKTYMQGSANRSTVISALLAKKTIYLPYTSLQVLELMTNLKPDWHYVFYGKYPNIQLAKHRLGVPKFVIDRQDPNDADSTVLLYKALTNNQKFNNFVSQILEKTNFDKYKDILTKEFIGEIKSQVDSIHPDKLNSLMRFVWVESIMQKHNLD